MESPNMNGKRTIGWKYRQDDRTPEPLSQCTLSIALSLIWQGTRLLLFSGDRGMKGLRVQSTGIAESCYAIALKTNKSWQLNSDAIGQQSTQNGSQTGDLTNPWENGLTQGEQPSHMSSCGGRKESKTQQVAAPSLYSFPDDRLFVITLETLIPVGHLSQINEWTPKNHQALDNYLSE